VASYHFSAQVIKRSANRSAVAAAAYRSGERLQDERSQCVHDYTKKRGVTYAEIMLPEGADPRLADRQYLWNEVERVEKRRDAQLARDVNIALPHELSEDERKALLQGFVREQFVDKGMIADVAIHAPVKENGDHEKNHHAHIMLTLRQADKDGLYQTKTRAWNSKAQMQSWRKAWADHQNAYLERGGHKDRVDHRTLKEQREEALQRGDEAKALALDREPEIHVGAQARQIARKRYFRQQAGYPSPSPDTRTRSHYNPPQRDWNRGYDKFTKTRADYNLEIMERNQKRLEHEEIRLKLWQMKLWKEKSYHAKKLDPKGLQLHIETLDSLVDRVARDILFVLGLREKVNERFIEYLESCLQPEKYKYQSPEMCHDYGRGRERPYPNS
jgi:hypothetical protein